MEITEWIKNPKRKYKDGVALYAKHGSNRIFLSVFQSEETEYNWEKLTDLLTALIPKPSAIKHVTQAKPQNIPEIVQSTYDRAMRLYKECGQLHARLTLYVTDAERLDAAMQIADKMDEVERCWDFYDHYIETGEILVLNDIPKTDYQNKSKADLLQAKSRLMVQRSKMRSKLESGGPEQKLVEWRDKLTTVEQELKQVNELLSGEVI